MAGSLPLDCRLATATTRVLIIDYGALSLPSDHDPSLPIPAVGRLLEQIRIETNTRLVLISDRHCRTADSLLGLDPAPEIWGVGGLERLLPDGTYELPSLDERALRDLAEADDWAEAAGLLPWIEQKPGGIALLESSTRAAESNAMGSRAWTAWSEIAMEYGLSLLNLEHGVEPRVPSRTRVEAIEAIVSETHRSVPVAYLATECSVNSHSMLWAEGHEGFGPHDISPLHWRTSGSALLSA